MGQQRQSGADLQRDPHLRKIRQSESAGGWIWINLVPLARLAMNRYDKDPCSCFKLDYREEEYDVRDAMLDEKMHKAIRHHAV